MGPALGSTSLNSTSTSIHRYDAVSTYYVVLTWYVCMYTYIYPLSVWARRMFLGFVADDPTRGKIAEERPTTRQQPLTLVAVVRCCSKQFTPQGVEDEQLGGSVETEKGGTAARGEL